MDDVYEMKRTYLALTVGLTLPEAKVPDPLTGFFQRAGTYLQGRDRPDKLLTYSCMENYFMVILGQWVLSPFKDKNQTYWIASLLPPLKKLSKQFLDTNAFFY